MVVPVPSSKNLGFLPLSWAFWEAGTGMPAPSLRFLSFSINFQNLFPSSRVEWLTMAWLGMEAGRQWAWLCLCPLHTLAWHFGLCCASHAFPYYLTLVLILSFISNNQSQREREERSNAHSGSLPLCLPHDAYLGVQKSCLPTWEGCFPPPSLPPLLYHTCCIENGGSEEARTHTTIPSLPTYLQKMAEKAWRWCHACHSTYPHWEKFTLPPPFLLP